MMKLQLMFAREVCMMYCFISNVIANKDKTAIGSSYNPVRAQSVVQWANDFLDKTIPLTDGSYSQLKFINIQQNKLEFTLVNGNHTLV
ncbi:hypothetical protein [Isorropodon fossajaponicum symbiont]|uniref:hypothetical protein n=1 Tax=Isorropodon fossajaponicum symbiont TaxID=883811 RepID=UPI00191683C8|nr:hypothetical protein [Isorropodon fossajaponicum symbiont]